MSEPLTNHAVGCAVTVLICEPKESCRLGSCRKPADLVVTVPYDSADAPGLFCCVNHWGVVRRGFVKAGRDIRYGEGAPELIVERLSTRLVSDGAGAQQ